MLKRPSSRRKSRNEGININLVPMLDALVTLVSFLLLSTAFMSIAVIDTPAPMLAPADEQVEKLKDQPLQLTAYLQEKQIILSDLAGSRVNQVIPNIEDVKTHELVYDTEAIHRALVAIKGRFPKDLKLILKPDSGVAYDSVVKIIDAARSFDDKADAPLMVKDDQGVERQEKRLFPEVIFGNIMDGASAPHRAAAKGGSS